MVLKAWNFRQTNSASASSPEEAIDDSNPPSARASSTKLWIEKEEISPIGCA
jgi:hypothetical protein